MLASAVHFLNVEVSLTQELSVEDRACITNAVAKPPQVAALKIEGSRHKAQQKPEGEMEGTETAAAAEAL